MEINFSNTEITFVYGHFCKKLKQLEQIAAAPNCPFDKKTMNNELKLHNSILQKLEEAVPNLANMRPFIK